MGNRILHLESSISQSVALCCNLKRIFSILTARSIIKRLGKMRKNATFVLVDTVEGHTLPPCNPTGFISTMMRTT
ncbi:hypothetical protein PGF_00009710 [Porphyromonas gingivalis 381]|nr:hypothetical protein PGF_00009710 [Porphyromonas gingivalis 381]